jgi:hypothetical protein
MRLFITYPFTFKDDPMKCEYIAEVVRVGNLGNNGFGVAVHLLKLRERLRQMSDDELIKFGRSMRGLSEPRVSVTPGSWERQN